MTTVFLYVGPGRVRVALRYESTTHSPRSDPQGCHESKNNLIGTPHTLGMSPLCDGLPVGLEDHCHHQAACCDMLEGSTKLAPTTFLRDHMTPLRQICCANGRCLYDRIC